MNDFVYGERVYLKCILKEMAKICRMENLGLWRVRVAFREGGPVATEAWRNTISLCLGRTVVLVCFSNVHVKNGTRKAVSDKLVGTFTSNLKQLGNIFYKIWL